MKQRRLVTIGVLLALWAVAAIIIRQDVLIPYPWKVAEHMLTDLTRPSFYLTVFATVGRMLKGLFAALALALVLGVTSGLSEKFKEYFSVLNDLIKTIPNMSYIIIVLIWLGAEGSVTVITFFILFPGLYANVVLGMNSLSVALKEVLALYPAPLKQQLIDVYWPQLKPYLFSGLKVAFGLGFKVSVMAEILGQVRAGIGKEIYYARNMLDMTAIFSWTLWIILLSILVDSIFDFVIRHTNRN